MKKTFVLGIVVIMLLACVGAVSANLVSNGGFEAPVITGGWNIVPDTDSSLVWDVQWASNPAPIGRPAIANLELQKTGAVEGIPSFEGDQHAELDTDWDGPTGGLSGEQANVIISQTFSTINGAHYAVSYEERCRSSDTHMPCSLQLDWTGASSDNTDGAVGSWTKYTFDKVATGPSTTISFTAVGVSDSIGALIDAVEVVETSRPNTPVPEFPTVALPAVLIVGMLGAVLFIQRTKEN